MESAPVGGFTAQECGDGVEVMGLDGDGVFWTVGGGGGDFGRELEGFYADHCGFFLKTASDANGGTGCIIEPESEG